MDPKAYLMGQGWSGPGNPLNPSRRPGGPHGGLGLTKPILVSKKRNTYGIGKKVGRDHTNQWWLKGFEEALKGVGTDGSATPTDQDQTANQVAKPQSELYRYFVRGEGLAGTISEDNGAEMSNGVDKAVESGDCVGQKENKKKRKRDEKGSNTEAPAKNRRTKKRRAEDGLKSASDDMTPCMEETSTKLKKKNKEKKKNRDRSKDSTALSSDYCNGESSSKEKSNKKRRRKEKREKERESTAEVSTEATDEKSNGTSDPSLSKEERKRLKALKKAAKDTDSKRKKKKSLDSKNQA